jgi:class 3 adenylate cyclase
MSEVSPTITTHVFLDVVDFSPRAVGEQAAIVKELNAVVLRALARRRDVPEDKRILIPTGDGVCVALQANEQTEFDAHIAIALDIVGQLNDLPDSPAGGPPKFFVRVGIDSNSDVEVVDINGNRNVAGAGINTAQRIMSLADGGQIIVSQTIYKLLKHHEGYPPDSFRRYDVLIKHDEPLTVYQYADRRHEAAGLNTDPPSGLEFPDIRKPGRQCGLVNVYPARNEQFYRDLRADIERAGERVWLSGIGLSVVARLADLLPLLIEKSEVRIDEERKLQVRLLLLDAMSSPAVFRTFLESDNQEFREFLGAGVAGPGEGIEEHPYFKHQLFLDCLKAYERLARVGALQDSVRFYAHNPNCWLAIMDDTIYFQPYTFGGEADNEVGSFTIGHLMPVFKFRRGELSDTFQVLEDHFNKLWVTTDTDLFHVGVRLAGRERLIRLIFRARRSWFKHVYGALYPFRESDDGGKERVSPRKPCRLPNSQIMVSWLVDGHTQKLKYDIINYSRAGVLLEVTGKSHPSPGEVVDLAIVPKEELGENENETPEAKYLKDRLIKPTRGKFMVLRMQQRLVRKKNGTPTNQVRDFIALGAHKADGAVTASSA